jgi:hypothetical protein
MRKLENAIVGSVAAGDMQAAHDHMKHLLLRDRRRAWWVVFRVAAAQSQGDRREALLAIVGRAYVARRTGALVGTFDDDLLMALLSHLRAQGSLPPIRGLTLSERQMLEQWLPARLARSIFRGFHPPG